MPPILPDRPRFPTARPAGTRNGRYGPDQGTAKERGHHVGPPDRPAVARRTVHLRRGFPPAPTAGPGGGGPARGRGKRPHGPQTRAPARPPPPRGGGGGRRPRPRRGR